MGFGGCVVRKNPQSATGGIEHPAIGVHPGMVFVFWHGGNPLGGWAALSFINWAVFSGSLDRQDLKKPTKWSIFYYIGI